MGICFQFIDGQFLAFILPLEGSFTFSSLGLGVLLVWGMGGKRSEADLIHGHLEIVDVILLMLIVCAARACMIPLPHKYLSCTHCMIITLVHRLEEECVAGVVPPNS